MARRDIAEERKEYPSLHLFHLWDLGKLFPALLSHILLLRLYVPSRHWMRDGHLCGGKHCCFGANTEWGGTMAFRRQDDAYPIWCGRPECTLLRAHSAHGADNARDSHGHICVGGVVISFAERNEIKELKN